MIEDPRFAAAPTFGKLAVEGQWEQALVLQPSGVTLQDVEEFLGQSEEAACEAFFGSAFFGVRTHGPGVMQFVIAFVKAMRSATSGSAFFEAVRDLGVVPATGFQYAELGAEGAWNSVGPLRICDPCAALSDTDSLWHAVTASPVWRDRIHEKALEFAFSGGEAHWFALPISDDRVISRSRLEDELRSFCG